MPEPDVPRLNVSIYPLAAAAVDSAFSSRWLASYFGRLGNPTLEGASSQPFDLELFRFGGRDLRLARQLLARSGSVRESLRRHAKTEDERKQVLKILFLLHQSKHLVEAG